MTLAASALLRPETREVTSLSGFPFDRALVVVAGCVLQCAVLWAWLAGSVTVAQAWRGVVPRRRRAWHLPGGARRLVLAGCGVALTAGLAAPATAAPGDGHRDLHLPELLAGLPLPDRAVVPGAARLGGVHTEPGTPPATRQSTPRPPTRPPTPRPPTPPPSPPTTRPATPQPPPPHELSPSRSVVVAPGDTLWAIAARDLPPGAGDAAVAARWQAIYAANRSVVGPDPDLLVPGQRLDLPERS